MPAWSLQRMSQPIILGMQGGRIAVMRPGGGEIDRPHKRRVSRRKLWSWVDRGAGELDRYLDLHPDERDRVSEIRAAIARLREAPDSRIDRYEIIGVLGEGGQGIVYRATQSSPKREVALKVLRAGRALDDHGRRLFDREIAALARLRHPAIAAIHEAGLTADGRPFFAMELIEGLPVHEFAREQRLPMRERLRLMQQVCEATHYAHQRGVLHRDLKPSNILVDAEGGPHLLDFGLARVIDVEPTGHTTQVGHAVGTLPYMSPEQARGDLNLVNVTSDVYALGVVLYEVLTGVLPYEIDAARAHIAVATICHRVPRPMGAGLPYDVQAITRKALEKDPARRYASAQALADDLDRVLRGLPVEARPPSAWYQLNRLVSRHPIASGLAATVAGLVVVLAVVASIAAARVSSERDAAQRQAAIARGILELLNRDVLRDRDSGRPIGRDPALRVAVDGAAAEVDEAFRGQPLVEGSVRLTLGNVYHSLGLRDRAVSHLQRAYELLRRHGGADDLRTLDSLDALVRLGAYGGTTGEAEAVLRRSMALREGRQPEADSDRLRPARQLADLLATRGKFAEAETLLRRVSGSLAAAHGADDPQTLRARDELALVHQRMGRFDESERGHREVWIALSRILGEDDAQTLASQIRLAAVLTSLERLDEAQFLAADAVERARRTLGAEHPLALEGLAALAGVQRCAGRLPEAEAILQNVLEARQRTLGSDDPATLESVDSLLRLAIESGRSAETGPLCARLRAAWQRTERPDDLLELRGTASCALAEAACGRLTEAERLHRRALTGQMELLGRRHPDTLQTLCDLALVLLRADRPADAEPLLVEAVTGLREVLGDEHPRTIDAMGDLAGLLARRGRDVEAERFLLLSMESSDARYGDVHSGSVRARCRLAKFQLDQGRAEEAEGLIAAALPASLLHGEGGVLHLEASLLAARVEEAKGRPEQARALFEIVASRGIGPGETAAIAADAARRLVSLRARPAPDQTTGGVP